MTNACRKLFAAFALLLSTSFAHAAGDLASSGSILFSAQPGSWVGGALPAPDVVWVHGVDGLLSAQMNFDKGVSLTFDNGQNWSFDFAAPTYDPATNTNPGNLLQVGFYDQATRFPFNSPTRPGLNVSGNGRGNNTLGGWFNVLDIAYGPSDSILRFAVDFRQFDESPSMTGPSLYGSLRFNSAIPLNPVPEPAEYMMLGAGLAALLLVVKRRARTALA